MLFYFTFMKAGFSVKSGTVKVTELSSAEIPPTAQRGVICTAPVTGLDGGHRQYQVSKRRRKSACWSALTPRPWIVYLIVSCS